MLLSAESVVITVIAAGGGSTPSASAVLHGLMGGDGGGGRQGFTMAVGLGRGDGQARTALASNGGREESLRGEGDGRRGSCLGKEVKGGSAGQVMSELRTGTSAFLLSGEHISSGLASSEGETISLSQ